MDHDVPRAADLLLRHALPVVSAHPRPALLDPVVRAAVLVDLALSGALANEDDQLAVDTTPTGYAPADRLLAAVVARPDKPLAWWLYRAPLTADDIAATLVARSLWTRHGLRRRYVDARPEQTARERERLSKLLRNDPDPVEACAATLLGLLPLPGRMDLAVKDGAYGAAAWLVPDLEIALRQRQAQIDSANRDAIIATGATYLG